MEYSETPSAASSFQAAEMSTVATKMEKGTAEVERVRAYANETGTDASRAREGADRALSEAAELLTFLEECRSQEESSAIAENTGEVRC